MDNDQSWHGRTGDDALARRPPALDQIVEFRNAAVAAGLIRPGDPIPGHLVDFAYKVVELCVRPAESHADTAMDEASASSPGSIRTLQFVRAARLSGAGLGLGETPPSEEPLAVNSPEAEARDRAFVELVHAFIRRDDAACAELQCVLAEADELTDAHAALGLVLIERAQRVLAESNRSGQA